MALTDNLISYWELEEASGTRNDAHGTNHLTDNNTVASGTGKVGTCADFQNSNESLSCADNADLSAGDTDFSVCAWVNLSTDAFFSTIITKDDGTDTEYQLYFSAGTGRFTFLVMANGSTFVTRPANTFGTPSASTWYFLTAYHDSVNDLVGISVNDGTVDTSGYASGSQDTTGAFRIGATSFSMNGLVDQVGFWKRVLTSGEITQLYNAGAGLTYAALSGGGGGDVPPSTRLNLLGIG